MLKKTCMAVALAVMVGCGGSSDADGVKYPDLEGTINIDGSSTVFPVSAAAAEEFAKLAPKVKIPVKFSGTGSGFKKFVAGSIEISNASRPIKEKEEKLAAEKKVEFIELPVAYDGIAVVVNPKNSFVDYLSVAELKSIFEPGSDINNWEDVRDGFPDKEIKIYAPGQASGTFDYFTEEIVGKSQACRNDATFSEDDNVLVTGVAGDEGAIGFFGFSYYAENKGKIRSVPIDGGKGAVAPTFDSINDGSYTPLSRPLFIYVSAEAAKRKEVETFVNYYLDKAGELAKDVQYVPLSDEAYKLAKEVFAKRVTGCVFRNAPHGSKPEALLKSALNAM